MTTNSSSAAVRGLAVCSLLVAAVAHIPVTPEHLQEAPYMGVAFIVFTIAAVALAGLITVSDDRRGYATTVALCTAAIVVYAMTRLVAFPEIGDDVGNWTETLGLVSITTEAVAALAAAVLLRAGSATVGARAVSM